MLSRKAYKNSYAPIFWDNAFPLPSREMFETRDTVSWSELACSLSCKFKKDVGCFLNPQQLEFIYTMIPNKTDANLITWEQFAKMDLHLRKFSFFEWFYKNLSLVREHLSQMFCSQLIHGFISSNNAEELLSNCVDGTFLIRFCETFCGALSIAYINNRKFEKLLPWDLDHLKKYSLAKTIRCNPTLLYLYPNYDKNEVFQQSYVHKNVTRSVTGKDYSDVDIAQTNN